VWDTCGACKIVWSLVETSGHDLSFEYEIHASEEVYVGDRLWLHDDEGRPRHDPMGVYRFVRDGSLRLVFAQAPYASNVLPHFIFEPFYSRIRAGETRRKQIRIASPVTEYSSLAQNIEAPSVLEEVSRVHFVLSYRLRSSMARDPAPPLGEKAEDVGYIVNDPSLVLLSRDVAPLLVRRRTGYVARFALPGEPPPGPAPVPD
jgi:hypothetical protein